MRDERIIRLVGDGIDGASGGGLTLPDAFAAVLEQLADSPGPVPQELIVKGIARAVAGKELRVLAIWGSWDDFADDVITQLGRKGLVRITSLHDEGKKFFCELGEEFTAGKSLEVISVEEITRARGGHAPSRAETVTVYDAAEREQREKRAVVAAAATRLRTTIRRAGMLSPVAERLINELIEVLEGGRDPKGRPSLPGDEPDVPKHCPKCGQWKPKTKRNFIVYWSRDQYYWRVKCKRCMTPRHILEYQDKLASAIRKLMRDNDGKVPTVEEVWKEMGISVKRVVEVSWSRMIDDGEDLPPVRK